MRPKLVFFCIQTLITHFPCSLYYLFRLLKKAVDEVSIKSNDDKWEEHQSSYEEFMKLSAKKKKVSKLLR